MNIYIDLHELKNCCGETVYVQPKVEINVELGEQYNTEVLKELKSELQTVVERGLSRALMSPVK